MSARLLFVFVFLITGCPGPSATERDSGAGLDASDVGAAPVDARPSDPDGSTPEDGATDVGSQDTACVCDDGVACTVDACSGGLCTSVAAHARCPAGQYCDATRGCRDGGACADSSDCPAPDACAVARCDAATRRCMYAVLDGDVDGEAPVVCGGADCDDSRATVSPTATETCNGTDDDCDGRIDEDRDAGSTSCGDRSACREGRCFCEIEGGWCGDPREGALGCRDLTSDPLSCGECERACDSGRACVDGECECGAGQTFCTSMGPFGELFAACTDTRVDELNCGACDLRCPDGIDCIGGVCACPVGETSCGGEGGGTAECVDLATDEGHCGGCLTRCPAGVSCVDGRCPCPGGVHCSFLDDTCTDLTVDASNCGRCGRGCDGGTCTAGVCRCDAGEVFCPYPDPYGHDVGGECVDLASSPSSCGACGRACGPYEQCRGGACVCADGYRECARREGRLCVSVVSPPPDCAF